MSTKLNLHSHTLASPDSVTTLDHIEKLFAGNVIDQLAITDHDEIWAAKEALERFGPEKIIVGSEISTNKDKHIIGLFLSEQLPVHLPALEIAKLIKEQGGLVYIPHPFEPKNGVGADEMDLLLDNDLIDIVEGFNSWVYPNVINLKARMAHNKQAWIFGKQHDLPIASSSDAHTIFDFKNAYTEISKPANKENIKSEIASTSVKYRRNMSSLNYYVPVCAVKKYYTFIFKRNNFRVFSK